ncbi:retrovirus-related pol polyprotein from transposon TNT 1-94 [Tanacetum coccineum]
MGKRAPEKNRCIIVNLHHDGVFTVSPFEYLLGDEKQIIDIHFEGTPLKLGINNIKTNSNVDEFVNFGYRNKWQVNLYVEDSGYDAFDIRDQEETMADDGNESSDSYFSSDEEDLVMLIFIQKLMTLNDWRKLLVYYGRDVEAGRRVGYDSMKKKKMTELGSLVTYRWIAHHYAKQLIADPFIPTLKMKTGIRDKFLINEYRQAILDLNPRSTCRLDDEETESGHYYFKRIYVCFKGVKECWLAGCRKVIGLDGCFLKHTCRGELLVAMGRDANKQMYLIAWAIVKVENNENWYWFISLIQEDLYFETGEGLTIISDSYKGLLEGNDASTTVEQLYISKMEELKVICPEAYQYLIKRNPNSWCRAYFRQEPKSPNFENGICESFNMAILVQRTKPIITMLEDIRLYIMQRLIGDEF